MMKRLLGEHHTRTLVQSVTGGGAVLGIAASIATVWQAFPGWTTVLLAISCLCVGALLWASLASNKYTREQVIDTGNRLLRATKHLAVLFGGDCSWAEDYCDSIRHLVHTCSKRVVVVHDPPQTDRARENLEKLEAAGAMLIENTRKHIRIRATILDPHSMDCTVYTMDRVLRPGHASIAEGLPGSGHSYFYRAVIFRSRIDQFAIAPYEFLVQLYCDEHE